jgi:hypothetical protein
MTMLGADVTDVAKAALKADRDKEYLWPDRINLFVVAALSLK